MKSNKSPEQSKYSKSYSEKSFFDKVKSTAQKAGIKVVYSGLLLFFTLQKSSTPAWAKATIISALGYFIVPLDAIADITPAVGFSDDLGAVVLALGAVAIYIDDDIKEKSKNKLKDWFGEYNEKAIEEINDKIKKK